MTADHNAYHLGQFGDGEEDSGRIKTFLAGLSLTIASVLFVRIILLCVTVAIALITALLDYGRNDRRTRQYRYRRTTLILLTCTFLLLSLFAEVAAHRRAQQSDQQADNRRVSDAKQINALQAAIKAEELANRRESKQALDALDRLQKRLAELQTKVTTAELQTELQMYGRELRSTRQALTPGPRATLTAYFGDLSDPDKESDATTLRPRAREVTFVMGVLNDSSVNADNGSIWFRVCKDCEVLEGPSGLQRVEGAHVGEYTATFQHLAPGVRMAPFKFHIKLPSNVGGMGIGFRYSCQTCAGVTKWEMLVAAVEPEFDFSRAGVRKPGT